MVISRQLATISERLEATTVHFSAMERNLELAMELLENCFEAYRRAPDDLRRRFNQAFFEKIYVDEDGDALGALAEPFSTILENRVGLRALDSKEPRALISQAQGSQERHLVPLEGLDAPAVPPPQWAVT